MINITLVFDNYGGDSGDGGDGNGDSKVAMAMFSYWSLNIEDVYNDMSVLIVLLIVWGYWMKI